MLKASSYLLTAALVCTACTGQPETTAVAPSRDDPELHDRRQELLTRKAPQPLPAPREATSITGEVPDTLLEKVRRDLAQRLGHERIQVRRAVAVVWPDGAMGCPRPGMVYTQATIDGYHVIFEAEGRRWDYRLNQRGGFQRCEKPASQPAQQYPAQ